jgi:hypothetical protein
MTKEVFFSYCIGDFLLFLALSVPVYTSEGVPWGEPSKNDIAFQEVSHAALEKAKVEFQGSIFEVYLASDVAICYVSLLLSLSFTKTHSLTLGLVEEREGGREREREIPPCPPSNFDT